MCDAGILAGVTQPRISSARVIVFSQGSRVAGAGT